MASLGEDSCFVKFSKFILIFVNVIFFLIGLGFIAGGALMLTNLNTLFAVKDQTLLGQPTIWGVVIFGIVLTLLSAAGCCGAMSGGQKCGKTFLTIYSIAIGIVMLAEIAVGITILLFAGKLGDLGKEMDKNQQVTAAKDEIEKALLQTASGLYTTCCSQNSTDFVCKGLTDLYTADNNGADLCAGYVDGTKPEDQPNFNKFVEALANWLSRYVNPAGIGFIAVGVIELLCMIAACHITCHAKSPEAKAAEMAVNIQDPSKQAQSNNLAYGAPDVGQLA